MRILYVCPTCSFRDMTELNEIDLDKEDRNTYQITCRVCGGHIAYLVP